MDRPDADSTRVLQQLSERELVPEAWGGDTIVVEVCALQGTGIESLLEQIVLVAEVEELTARVEGEARGVVLEANLEAGRGPVATVIVEQGTLRVGDPVVAGPAWGKVKALVDDRGDHIKGGTALDTGAGAGLLRAAARRRRGAWCQGPGPGPHAR